MCMFCRPVCDLFLKHIKIYVLFMLRKLSRAIMKTVQGLKETCPGPESV